MLVFSPRGHLLLRDEAASCPATVRTAFEAGAGAALLQLALLPDNQTQVPSLAFADAIGRVVVDVAPASGPRLLSIEEYEKEGERASFVVPEADDIEPNELARAILAIG